jgi:enamine deaminase RidA (YjgF/YER057c/UK114 family)
VSDRSVQKLPTKRRRTAALQSPPPTKGGRVLQPTGWPQPKGYANGMKAKGEMVFVGGMVGWDANERFPAGFVAQTRQALKNIVAVLTEGGARPEHVVRMTWYVVDMDEYRAARAELGAVYREVIGPHFPAMALIEVRRLVEPQALVEIEATAVLPED